MPNTKTFNCTSVNSMTPAVARIMVSRKVDGSLDIQSTLEPEESVQLLDEAMEEIDGQRLPPDGE